MVAAVERQPVAYLADGSTRRTDSQVIKAAGRTAAFWRRATRIYLGYKSAQVRAALLGHPGKAAKDKFWEKHNAWAGAEMYSLAVDMRGFYLKVCLLHDLIADHARPGKRHQQPT